MGSFGSNCRVGALAGCLLACGCNDYRAGDTLVVLQTNDRHSHVLGVANHDYDPVRAGDATRGGIARLAALVQGQRDHHENVVLVSGGDFSVGTIFRAAESGAADLNLMKELGYVAAALGNHEFDFTVDGLAAQIAAADQPTVPLLCANLRFSDGPEDDNLEALYGDWGEAGKAIHPYMVHVTPGGIRVGIFGLMGIEAADDVIWGDIAFSADLDELTETAVRVARKLREDEQVDRVVALAHMGIKAEEGEPADGETIELARRVEGIDIIVSGHEHSRIDQLVEVPCEANGSDWITATMEAGRYGEYLGRYRLEGKGDEKTITGELVAIDDGTPGEAGYVDREKQLVTDLEENFLPLFPLLPEEDAFLTGELLQVLAASGFEIPRHDLEANNVTNLVSDAMRVAGACDIAVVSNGHDIRGSFVIASNGEISLADAFLVTPMGIGPDGILGSPLVKIHLTALELFYALDQTTCAGEKGSNSKTMGTSGVEIQFDSSKASFKRIREMSLYNPVDESGERTVLCDEWGFDFQYSDLLLSICMSLDVASQLAGEGIVPRREDGTKMENIFEGILRDAEGREVKLWYAVAAFLASTQNGVPDRYCDDEAVNPVGPYWRRAWDLSRHPVD